MTVFAPRAKEDFASNTTASGFSAQGNTVTSPSGYMETTTPDTGSDMIGAWTAGGNVTDTNRVMCSITMDYTYSSTQHQALALCYEWFTAQLAIGHDGNGNLALWASGDARSGTPTHTAAMTGGKPAQGTKIYFRGTRQGNVVIVEEFRAHPNTGAAPNTSFTFDMGSGATYGAGVNGWKAGYVMHGPSAAAHFDDFMIEELITDRRTGSGRRVTPTADGGGGGTPTVPTTGRIWPRQR